MCRCVTFKVVAAKPSSVPHTARRRTVPGAPRPQILRPWEDVTADRDTAGASSYTRDRRVRIRRCSCRTAAGREPNFGSGANALSATTGEEGVMKPLKARSFEERRVESDAMPSTLILPLDTAATRATHLDPGEEPHAVLACPPGREISDHIWEAECSAAYLCLAAPHSDNNGAAGRSGLPNLVDARTAADQCVGSKRSPARWETVLGGVRDTG